MKCIELRQQFDDYLAGLLPTAQMQVLENHLEACAQCSQLLLEEDQDLDKLLQTDWHLVIEPEYLKAKTMKKVLQPKSAAWLWLVLAWVGYISLWTAGLGMVLFRHHFPRALESAAEIGRFLRSVANVLSLVISSLQLFRFSTLGIVVILSSFIFVFVAIGLLSKGEILQ